MSQENVQAVLRSLEAVARRDADAFKAETGPEFEFHSVLAGVDGKIYTGLDGMDEYLSDRDETWQEWSIDLARVIEADEDTVVALYTLTGTGRGSGARVSLKVGVVYTALDGVLMKAVSYDDQAEALRAAGVLAEE